MALIKSYIIKYIYIYIYIYNCTSCHFFLVFASFIPLISFLNISYLLISEISVRPYIGLEKLLVFFFLSVRTHVSRLRSQKLTDVLEILAQMILRFAKLSVQILIYIAPVARAQVCKKYFNTIRRIEKNVYSFRSPCGTIAVRIIIRFTSNFAQVLNVLSEIKSIFFGLYCPNGPYTGFHKAYD